MLLSGLGSVRIVKNCDLGLEKVQFFPIRTSQPANNVHVFLGAKNFEDMYFFHLKVLREYN